MRRDLVGWLSACVLFVPGLALAQEKDKSEPPLPRLGLDPAEPSVRSAPPATPFGVAPATSKEYVLDFHGYMLLPMQIGVQSRPDPAGGESSTVLHTPAIVPQDYRRFQYTGVVPNPWLQLNLTYGNSTIAGTVILASTAATEGEAFYEPARQLGISDAYVTLNLKKQLDIPLQIRGGAMHHRYGSMGAFDAGRYATPLIARINAIGEVATASFKLGEKSSLVVEQGLGGQIGRMPSGTVSAGWNDYSDPNVGSSYVSHVHAGLNLFGLVQIGAHYITAWSQDDQNPDGTLKQGRITVTGADARLTAGRGGHLYAGIAQTDTTNSNVVSGIVEVLNARGGPALRNEYFGPNSGGNGHLTTFGAQYDFSVARAMYGDQYRGRNPDVLFSVFGIGTKVKSDDPAYSGVLKLKGGAEVTYTMLSWFGVSGRMDQVRQNFDYVAQAKVDNSSSFTSYTGRLLFHTGWMSRDEFALSYTRFMYGKTAYVANGSPAVDNPNLNPDRHVLTLSATFWW